MANLIRVTLRYDATHAQVVRAIPIRGPAPAGSIEVEEESSGGWIEVVDAQGMVTARRALPDPHAGQEMLMADNALERMDDPVIRTASIELPWPGPGATLVVHARGGSHAAGSSPGMAAAGPPTSEIARMALNPQPLPQVMGASADPVASIRPIWGHDNPKALTLLFMSEGFTQAEMAAFHQAVDRCVHAFEATQPYSGLLNHLRVAEVEIASQTSGIAGTEPGATPFRAHFQAGSLGRVILIDQQKAALLLDRVMPSSAVALVVANTPIYGGSGGSATVFSCEPNWSTEIAIHELGHSRFGLADEYDAAGQAATMKPVEPNVCGSAERGELKWRDLVAQGTPLPTQAFGAPVPPGEPLGAYEGAKYRKQGLYRPARDCKMRTPGVPFCQVCQRVIAQGLAPHAP